MRMLGAVGVLAVLGILQAGLSSAQAAQTITIAPDTPTAENNFPFGTGQTWIPYMGFVYKDVPAFQLKANDSLAFDLSHMNEADDRLDIALAPTTTNGGDIPAAAFTKIVSKAQLPANPRGDTVDGNYELEYTAQTAFNFPGGGLIIRFSNPGTDLAADDGSTEGPLENGGSDTDTSGFFVERFWRDMDGLYPWTGDMDFDSIAAFRLQILDLPPEVPATPPPALPATAKKKKCKKKHKKHAASLAKKKCRRRRRRRRSGASPLGRRLAASGPGRCRSRAPWGSIAPSTRAGRAAAAPSRFRRGR